MSRVGKFILFGRVKSRKKPRLFLEILVEDPIEVLFLAAEADPCVKAVRQVIHERLRCARFLSPYFPGRSVFSKIYGLPGKYSRGVRARVILFSTNS